MNLNALQAETSQQQRIAPLKFAFASGSKPLPGYTIKRGVGRGGFGEVYYAVSDAGKEVALKLIRRNLDVELRGVTHCLNLKHPHLLALYDVKHDDQENCWVIMEYVPGPSLEDVVQDHPHGIPVEQALEWMHGIAAGVAYLHDHGIVHRDLKPGNIFLDEGFIKLGDYGLSKFISCSRRSGQTESVGTVHYMAPEVANGRYGKEIDIYALGIILYEMLTGHVPFEGESVGEVLMKHLTAEPDLSALQEPYRTVVGRALAKDPTQRFSSVDELMAQLPAPTGTPVQLAALRRPAPPLPEPEQASDVRLAAATGAASAGTGSTGAGPTVGPPKPEPILHGIQTGYRNLQTWSDANLNTGAKAAILIVLLLVVLPHSTWVVPLVAVLMLAYGGYWLVRAVVLQPTSPPTTSTTNIRPNQAPPPTARRHNGLNSTAAMRPAMPVPPPGVAQPSPMKAAAARGYRQRWRENPLPAMVLKSPRERLTDLAGSMLLSAGIAAALSVVMVLLRGVTPHVEQYVWLTLVSVLGSWCVLIPAKLWEGTKGERALRHFALMVIGLGLGTMAWAVSRGLYVQLPLDSDFTVLKGASMSQGYFDAGGNPLLYAFVIYFGLLFLLVRWWRQADPLRPSRLSLWSTACCLGAAWVIDMFWRFPQPWGFMVAATISISVQLASPWVSHRERLQSRKN